MHPTDRKQHFQRLNERLLLPIDCKDGFMNHPILTEVMHWNHFSSDGIRDCLTDDEKNRTQIKNFNYNISHEDFANTACWLPKNLPFLNSDITNDHSFILVKTIDRKNSFGLLSNLLDCYLLNSTKKGNSDIDNNVNVNKFFDESLFKSSILNDKKLQYLLYAYKSSIKLLLSKQFNTKPKNIIGDSLNMHIKYCFIVSEFLMEFVNDSNCHSFPFEISFYIIPQYQYNNNSNYVFRSKHREKIETNKTPLIKRRIRVFLERVISEIKQYGRYTLIIDRRNPECIDHKIIPKTFNLNKDNEKDWKDRMYFFKSGNTINKNFHRVPETFFYSSHGHKAFEKCFCLSYQCIAPKKIKIYWSLDGFRIRFLLNRMTWFWNKYFVENQTVNNENMESLKRLTQNYELVDHDLMMVYKQVFGIIIFDNNYMNSYISKLIETVNNMLRKYYWELQNLPIAQKKNIRQPSITINEIKAALNMLHAYINNNNNNNKPY